MNKHLLKSIGAACMSAAVTLGSLSVLGGSVPTVSAADTDNYAKLLQYSLYFYDCNWCGSAGSESAITWRGDCHTDDEIKGGFHDAGDHAVFGLPQGYTASTLGWAYREFKDAFNSTGQAAHFKKINDHFIDFIKASTKLSGDSVSSLLYQKGDGDEDHKYWGPPEMQGGGRKMFWTSNSASDIAAEYAAALALNYINFGDQESLDYAKALYKFSVAYNKCEPNGPSGFYYDPEYSDVKDEQAWAAGWLYLATKDEYYKGECASHQTQYLGWVHSWNNVAVGAAIVYAEITGDWSNATGWIGGQASGNGYYCLDDWGSARLNCSLQTTLLIANKHGAIDKNDWCKAQMTYLLGENPFNTCFVTGFASNSCKNTHHRGASGYNNYDELGENTTYGPNGKVLVGALTGGPNKAGQYSDSIKDYQCNEVALDYNAGLVAAAAGLYSIYKTGSVDTSIPGVDTVSNGQVDTPPTTTPAETTQPQQTQPEQTQPQQTQPQQTTQPSNSGNSGSGKYELKVGDSYNYDNMSEKMIGFKYSDFGLSASSKEKITKVEVDISASSKIGTWQGAFGSSTTVAADEYWTMTDQMEQVFSGNSGTIVWQVPAKTADIIQYGYDGEIKVGFWWIDNANFTIDAVRLYTDGSGSGANVTQAPATTTTTTTTTTTQPQQQETTEAAKNDISVTLKGDANLDNKVTVADAVLVARVCAEDGSAKITDQGKVNGDVDGKDGLTVDDVTMILMRVADLVKW